MSRLPSRWANRYVQETLSPSSGVVDVFLAPDQQVRSFGHIIADLGFMLFSTADPDLLTFAEVTWGIYYGPEGSSNLNQPSVGGEQWLGMGVVMLSTGWANPGTSASTYIRTTDTGHASLESRGMRTHEFGSACYLQLRLGMQTADISVSVRGYTRILQFLSPIIPA